MPKTIRIATRNSKLALWQANKVGSLLGCDYELIEVKTTGDVKVDVPISEIGGIGAFAKEVQTAVLKNEADIAVHSAKDLPAITPDGLKLAAVPIRGDVRDALVGSTLSDLKENALVATGSQRRRAQLAHLRPDLRFEDLRGNMQSRLEKAKEFDAIVVAYVALERLGLEDQVSEIISVESMLPQVAQGALAVEIREDDVETLEVVNKINNQNAFKCVTAERAFLEKLGGGCTIPCAGYATTDGDSVTLSAMLASVDGQKMITSSDKSEDPVELGYKVAFDILQNKNGSDLLKEIQG